MTDEQTPDLNMQPALPALELPEFEGLRPVGVITKVNGAGSRIHRPMHLEEKVVLVIEAEVSNVGHGMTDDGVKRIHTIRVRDLYELEGKTGSTLLRSLRQAYNLADDARHGRTRLGMAELEQPESNAAGIEVVLDDQGRVHTAPAGAAGGEVLPGLPHVDVAVLVFDDESRALWPDDFGGATGPHPEAGERIRKPGAKTKDDPVLVRAVLDADTGETVEEWTDEQENERLREQEHAAQVEEARLDREAAEELERGRAAHPSADQAPPLPGEVPDVDDETHPRFRAVRLLNDPVTGTARAIGSVKKDLADVDDVLVVEAAIGLERGGKNRSGMLEALEARATELRP